VRRIVFVEVKTGGAGLTGRERMVREAVREGQIEWVELRVAPRASGVA
jgi:predicted Holliday junction resolvase-like endonuclease